jgi:hypothetical protein
MSEQYMSDVVKERNSSEHDQGIGEREVKGSSQPITTSAGPRVIRRKSREGGYFVVFRKESALKTAEAWWLQRTGSP